ncbi:DnaJ-domain-containing protein [Leucogyrophana mollusca]|uniref:DnaJ-domain-containing protein n=1 Tax=Leucogyrophana mollusca TaxID=85980 RepID=A0ACB8BQT0_9AGAM|nr:DnaJ-domain-containing protein [Leucogyrophana mollusca]
MMFSYVFSSATTLFYLPGGDDKDPLPFYSRRIPWLRPPQEPPPSCETQGYRITPSHRCSEKASKLSAMNEVLSTDDLYCILGIPRSPTIDKITIRRAYLSRSKACHPDKFPGNPKATHAFQKVSVAYDVLSQPASKRMYDSRSPTSQCDFFASRSAVQADETLKGVILGIISDFLDGDMEMIRTLLRAINDINPSLRLGDDGINSVLSVFQRIRERALTCRTCIVALHTELIRVLEIQSAFRQLPYFDITGRSRLTIQLTRITLSLPVTLEKAIQEQHADFYSGSQPTNHDRDSDKTALLPRQVILLIRGIDVILDRMERILG